jgi:hypothetical protein
MSYMHEGKRENKLRDNLCSTTKSLNPSNFNEIYYITTQTWLQILPNISHFIAFSFLHLWIIEFIFKII